MAERMTVEAASAGTSRRRWLTLGVVGIAQLMVVLDATIVNVALPSAQRALGFTDDERSWIVTAYGLTFGGLLLIGGRLADRFGRRTIFVVGLVGFAVASAAGGAAPTFGALVAARAVQGAFAALLAPSALSILTTTFDDPSERRRALGVFTSIAGGGGVVGLVLGGALTQYLSWRWCLYVNVIFAAIALGGTVIVLGRGPRQSTSRAGLDIPGALLAVSGVACIVYGFSAAAPQGWSSPQTWGPIAAAVLMLAGFVVVERRSPHPLVPLGVLTSRTRGTAYLSTAVAGIALIGTFLLVTYYLQGIRSFTPLEAGLAFLPLMAGVTVGANLVSNIFLARFGPRVVVPASFVVAAAGAAWLTRLDTQSPYLDLLLPALILIGLGLAGPVVSAFALGPTGVAPENTGVASALVNSSNQIGGAVGAALLNTIAASAATAALVSTHSPAVAVVDGFRVAFGVAAALLVGGAIISALLFPRRFSFRDRPPQLRRNGPAGHLGPAEPGGNDGEG